MRGQTTRRFLARVSIKFQDNTIISLGGVAPYGPNRSRELADEMADGWAGVMQCFSETSLGTAALLRGGIPQNGLDDTAIILRELRMI